MAHAGGGTNTDLARAKEYYMGLRFDAVLSALDKAMKFENRYSDMVEIYELMGLTYAALGQNRKAREAYGRLLMIDPEHRLPDYVAPRMGKALKEARAEHSKSGYIRASDVAPASVTRGDPLTVEVRLENDPLGMVARVRVSYRLKGRTDLHQTEVPAGPQARIALDATILGDPQTGEVEYWCTLLDRNGSELGFVGSADAPSHISITPPPPAPVILAPPPSSSLMTATTAPVVAVDEPPVYKRWWFWTATGAVVVGIAAGVTYAMWPRAPDRRDDINYADGSLTK